MGLCLVPTCVICQAQFVELDQVREHGNLTRGNLFLALTPSEVIKEEKIAEVCSIVMFVYNPLSIEKNYSTKNWDTWLILGLTKRWNLILTLKMIEYMH